MSDSFLQCSADICPTDTSVLTFLPPHFSSRSDLKLQSIRTFYCFISKDTTEPVNLIIEDK